MSALPKILSGPTAVKALEKVRQAEQNKNAWPYEHLFPPPNSIPVHQIGYAAVPAGGSSALVATYQVPEGFRFIMESILESYSGTFDPGDTLFTVQVNAGGGAQSTFVQGLIQTPVPLGAWEYGVRWYFDRPYEFSSLDLLSITAANVNLQGGSYVGGFFGYLLPSIAR